MQVHSVKTLRLSYIKKFMNVRQNISFDLHQNINVSDIHMDSIETYSITDLMIRRCKHKIVIKMELVTTLTSKSNFLINKEFLE